jgi:hypothetical protein
MQWEVWCELIVLAIVHPEAPPKVLVILSLSKDLYVETVLKRTPDNTRMLSFSRACS